MASGPRAQRKEFQRRIRSACRNVLRDGLPLQQDRTAMIALARVLRGKLEGKGNPGRVIDVARTAAEVFEKSLARNPPGKPVDCKMGCAYCCHRMVAVSAPEAFMVAAQIAGADEDFLAPDAYFERAARTTGLDADARHANRTPCALLRDDICAIYPARPLACRTNASHSVEACLTAFRGGESNIPAPKVHLFLGDRCRMAIYAALRSLGYPAAGYELSEAVTCVLKEDEALARWAGGEDIFKKVQQPRDRPAQLDAVITEMARAISF